jgi:hypothetical protein
VNAHSPRGAFLRSELVELSRCSLIAVGAGVALRVPWSIQRETSPCQCPPT